MHKCAWQACKFDLLPSLQIGIETWNKHDILNSDQSFYSNDFSHPMTFYLWILCVHENSKRILPFLRAIVNSFVST